MSGWSSWAPVPGATRPITQRKFRISPVWIWSICVRRCWRGRAVGWPNARVAEADATDFRPEAAVDCVYFSYALTMISAWSRAIDNALSWLRPGGRLGIVDFHVAESHASPPRARHRWPTRKLWPWWFRHNGVHLSAEHLPTLCARTRQCTLHEGLAPVPYLRGLRVPYYFVVGTRI